jgi:DNA-binding CsgD family transcriptional regulator
MEQALRSIQRVCAAGLDSLSLRREIMQRIAPVIPFDASAFSTCDPDTGLMAHTLSDGIPAQLGRVYAEHFYPRECAVATMDMPARGECVRPLLEIAPETSDACRASGLRFQLHTSLDIGQRLWGTWCLMWSTRAPARESRARVFLKRVAPFVARGLRAAAVVDHGRAPDAESGVSGPGVLILDAAGRPALRTPLVTRWLADIADTGFGGTDHLPLSVIGLAAHLRRTRADVPGESFVRVRGASGRWYVLRASLTEPDASGSSSVVVVVRPALRRETAPMLTRLYALSDREREVVAAAARGEPTKRIAATLSVSPYTVEEHLTRACRKIGVRGRKALVAKLFVDGYLPGLMAGR